MKIPARLAELSVALRTMREGGELLLQCGDLGRASAPSNIALVKYWGKELGKTQIPVNASVSFTLSDFRSTTTVRVRGRFFPEGERNPGPRPEHRLELGDSEGPPPAKMAHWLDAMLAGWGDDVGIAIKSRNNFPTACGLASSASGYAAVAGAIADLLQLERRFSPEDLQYWLVEWARLGSGSATRSAWLSDLPSFVAWERAGDGTLTREWREAREVAALVEQCVVVVDAGEKKVSSSEGHGVASSSLLQTIRVAGIPAKLERLRQALVEQDWRTMADVTESEAFALHAVMQSGSERLAYFGETTARLIAAFVAWRDSEGVRAFWTLDAGPNVHILFHRDEALRVRDFLESQRAACPFVDLLWGKGGAGLRLGCCP